MLKKMKRFNYLEERSDGFLKRLLYLIPQLETSARTRHSFLACAITAVLCSLLSLWQNTELRISQVQYIRSISRLERDETLIAHLQPISEKIGRLGANARKIGEVRGTTVERLKIIAEIGDHLSPRIWLIDLQEDGSVVHLRGRAFSATDVGAALSSLSHLPGLEQPRLDQLHASNPQLAGPVEFDLLLKEVIH